MTKKILSFLLALILCIGLCTVFASAAGTTHEVTDEASLAAALAGAVDGDTISLKNDITWASSSKALIAADITVEGNGNTLKFTNTKYGLRMEDIAASGTTIQNLTIVSTVAAGRCINIFSDGIENITIDKCYLDTESASGAPQPITIGGEEADNQTTNIKITDTTIKGGTSCYGIISFLTVDMYIENCTIEGWNALYLKVGSDGSYVQVSDTTINTVNVHSGASNAFSAVVIDSDSNAVDFYNTDFNCSSEGDQSQFVVGFGSAGISGVEDNEVVFQPDCVLNSETILVVNDDKMIDGDDEGNGRNTVLVPAEYAEQLVNDGFIVAVSQGYAGPALTQNTYEQISNDPEHKLTAVVSQVPVCAEGGHVTYYACDCEFCGEEIAYLNEEGTVVAHIDDIAPEAHTLSKVKEVAATETKEGCKEHYACSVCGGLFSDAEGTKAVKKADLVIAKLAPKNPPTSDINIAVICVVMVIAMAATVVIARAKNRV